MDIYKISMTSCQAINCTNEKGKGEKSICYITDPTLVNTSTTVCEKHGKERQNRRPKRKKSTCMH